MLDIGSIIKCPPQICDTEQLIIVGVEHARPQRLTVIGSGQSIYHVCEAKDGKKVEFKPWFAVGTDEVEKWRDA